MKVSPEEPFQLIYSLLEHEFLGYLFEAFVVQLNARGELTLLNQTLSTKNAHEFADGLDEADFELVRIIDEIQQDVILKKFNVRKLAAVNFFLKVYDTQKGDKELQDRICEYIEQRRALILERLGDKKLFIMGNDGNPAWMPVERMTDQARVYFNFVRTDIATEYFPIVKYAGERVEFQFKDALLICDDPAWMMVNNRLYHFDKSVDGKKLRPFLRKRNIVIPKNIEDQYYHRFVAPLIAAYDVYARGFEIRSEVVTPTPVLTITEQVSSPAQRATSALFDRAAPELMKTEPRRAVEASVSGGTTETQVDEVDTEEADLSFTAPTTGLSNDSQVVIDLLFQYGQFTFRYDSFAGTSNVSIEKKGNDYVFHKIKRDIRKEKATLLWLKEASLDLKDNGHGRLGKAAAFEWLQQNYHALMANGFQINQNATDAKRYFLGYSSIVVSINETRDWFDIYAKVQFGEFEIPFIKLRSLILNKKIEFTLPNGEIAVIPETWFTKYSELFAFMEREADTDQFVLKKHHVALVQELQEGSLASAVISRKLEQLRSFEEIGSHPLPAQFKGALRPYQKAGYDWLQFLSQYRFGGCLADDMGLGKTVMTLAMLQSQKEAGSKEPTLLVMPTSLLYNWELEARRFTPDLRVMVYTGTYRDKNTSQFDNYDLILTSYGIVRIDIELLKVYRFNYVILDESQAIKNPSSHITRAVMQLDASHRLILTGTPLENSTMDLWTQMTFINPGLLGSQTFFRNEFLIPIEKKNDEQKTQRLYGIIKPFMLRRHKSQVALDLPEKVESIHYSDMTPEQDKQYEEAKSYYRNLILERIEEDGMAKSQMVVLQGLTKLRQIANHPRMIDETYEGNSGKLEDVVMRLEGAMADNHKILVFSQFVKHLDVIQQYLKERSIRYAYLDGSTQDRRGQVNLFQTNDEIKLFLISLKAGGLGHNLTAADYVFILDPWWNPAIEAQAIDRAHRIGQQRTVFTYKFITRNTVEEKILALQRSKQKLASELITSEENFMKSLTKEDIMVLLE